MQVTEEGLQDPAYIDSLCCIQTQAQSMLHNISLVAQDGETQVLRVLQYRIKQ